MKERERERERKRERKRKNDGKILILATKEKLISFSSEAPLFLCF